MADPQRYDMAALLDALRAVESNGRISAQSSVGAVGDMQQMRASTMDPGYGIPSIFDVAAMYGMAPGRDEASAKALSMDPEIARRWAYEYLTGAHRQLNTDIDQVIASYNAGISGVRGKDVASFDAEETRNYVPKVRAAYEEITGQALPQSGYFGAPIYLTPRPQRRPAGLLE